VDEVLGHVEPLGPTLVADHDPIPNQNNDSTTPLAGH
jgi:hypothetical protein